MTAWGVVESGVGEARTSGQSALWNGRNSGVGLDSSWGTVMGGLWDSPYKQLDGAWSIGTPAAYSSSPTGSIFGNSDTTGGMPNQNCVSVDGVSTAAGTTAGGAAQPSACANVPGSNTAFQRRLNNTFQYWSPVWNGVQILVATQANEEKANAYKALIGTSNPSMWSFGLRWTGPRWAFVWGHERHKNFNVSNTAAGQATPANVTAGTAFRSSKDTGSKIGGNYNFGPVMVSLAFERLTYQLGTIAAPTDRRERNWSIGLAAPIGNGVIRGQASRGRVTGSSLAATGDANGRLFNISYEHNLSKRTLVYIAHARLTQGDLSARSFGGGSPHGSLGSSVGYLAGQDPRIWSFGMNHNF
jgi:predicted porin